LEASDWAVFTVTLEEKREIERAVIRLIEDDFHKTFEPIYSAAALVLGDFIAQACEEIRNVLNHMASALAAESVDDARLNLARGKKHLLHAIYICLFLSAMQDKSSADAYVRTTESRDHRRYDELREFMDEIDKERKKIQAYNITQKSTLVAIEEDIKDLKVANQELARLVAIVSAFQEYLPRHYPAPGLSLVAHTTTGAWRVWNWAWEHLYKILFWGIVIHIVGALFYALAVAKHEDKVRDFLKFEWLTGNRRTIPAPNNPPPAPNSQSNPEPTAAPSDQPVSGNTPVANPTPPAPR
jgi:hypothetical protein